MGNDVHRWLYRRHSSPVGRSRVVEAPASHALPGKEAAELQAREVSAGDRNVRPLQLPRVGLPDLGRELLIMVHQEVEVVIHQLERAVDDIAEKHGPIDAVGEDDDAAAGGVARSESHVDPG